MKLAARPQEWENREREERLAEEEGLGGGENDKRILCFLLSAGGGGGISYFISFLFQRKVGSEQRPQHDGSGLRRYIRRGGVEQS